LITSLGHRFLEFLGQIVAGQFVLDHAGEVSIAALEIELHRAGTPGSVLEEGHVILAMLAVGGIKVYGGTALEV